MIVYLNGEYLPQEQAKISVFDRGFLFGDAIYEVIPVFNGHCLRVQEHLARMQRSLQAVHMHNPLTNAQWLELLEQLMQRNAEFLPNLAIYIEISRGAQSKRSHPIPKDYQPTVVAFCIANQPMSAEVLAKGFSAITLANPRRRDCHIKAVTLLPNILALHEAHSQQAIEAILLDGDQVLEGCSSNVFAVKQGVVITPPANEQILGGITRELVLEILEKNNLAHEARPLTKQELLQADEVWLTSSMKEIAPVTEIDKQVIGNGQAGPMWQQVFQLYQQYKEKL